MPTQKELDILMAETSARYTRHLKPGLDPVSIVLKGHLFTEELLQDILGLSPGSVRHEAGYPVFCLKLFAYSFGERYPRAECSRLLL